MSTRKPAVLFVVLAALLLAVLAACGGSQAQSAPKATLRVIAGASHGMFWELPERSAEILLDWTGAR